MVGMKKAVPFALGISAVLVLVSLYYATHSEKYAFWQTIDTVEFYLKDNNTGSIFAGTLFAQTNGELKRVVLIGWVNITESDFGGALVGIPHGWRLISAETDYRDKNLTNISDWMDVLVTNDPASSARYRIFIGPAAHGMPIQHPCGGGTGNIFVELVPEEDSKNLTVKLGVGSDFKVLEDGRKVLVLATTSKNVTIEFDEQQK
ncbi:hypothetical protein NF865_07485 [Thermococcus aggregans]|uniref:Uncharacterized protein n=1 Tax=Thermococcus aggregans TaxID=110163 RepID=A0A9E7MWE1_THEAG|nr:hypothetical protein [Thermococcus aggregans]USS40169.1 hypothetical protein NF865_07485 [Thermococcus aggregans]